MSAYEFESLPLTAFGDLRIAELSPIVQGSFEYTVDNTELNTNMTANSGTVTQADGMGIFTTGTTANSYAMLQSRRPAKYRAGFGGLFRFTTKFTSPVAGTEQHGGIIDELGSSATFKNGLTVGYDTSGVLNFFRFANDISDPHPRSTWLDPLDGTGPSGITFDPTKLNVWAIDYQYLGAGQIALLYEHPDTGILFIVAVIKYTNNNTVPSSYNPNYRATFYASNGATTNNIVMTTASYAYFVEGKTDLTENYKPKQSSGSQSVSAVTTEVPVFTIRNKSTYASKTNFIDILLLYLNVSVDVGSANNLATWRLVESAGLTGASYSDINTSSSVVDIDTSATALTGGKELISGELSGRADKAQLTLRDLELLESPGATITLAVSSSNSASFRGSLLWREEF